MQQILLDTGPLLALFDQDDRYHPSAIKFIKKNNKTLVTSLAVVTETNYVLDFDWRAQKDFLTWLARGAVQIYPIESSELLRIQSLMEKYRDLPMDFADASLVFMAKKLNLNSIATIDRDFMIYRINSKRKFKNVFPLK